LRRRSEEHRTFRHLAKAAYARVTNAKPRFAPGSETCSAAFAAISTSLAKSVADFFDGSSMAGSPSPQQSQDIALIGKLPTASQSPSGPAPQ
jgi:hypothetical protein